MKDPTKGVVVGCFGGFWGDSMDHAVAQFLRSKEGESIDYLVSDYLAEVTMCILAKKKARPSRTMGEGGFVEDFVTRIWKPMGQMIMERNITVIVNAGGMNPEGLKRFIEKVSADWPKKPKVAAVLGDDLLPLVGTGEKDSKLPQLSPFNVDGSNEEVNDDGITQALKAKKKLTSMNAYIGAAGIVRALELGSNIVVTGRCVDSAMILAPLCYEHNWNITTDFQQLAAGTIAGHVVECGAQCTGGNFTDWELSLQRGISANKLFSNIGFPLLEVHSDGSFIVTKPTGTGGVVCRRSVAEQLVYEVGDPTQYIVPDCVCDISQVTLEEVGKNRVLVKNIRGNAPTGFLKVTATYGEGYLGIFCYVCSGHFAAAKGKAIIQSILSRVEKQLVSMGAPKFTSVRVETIGTNASYFPTAVSQEDTAVEVVFRVAVHHISPKAIMLLMSHVASASTGMSPSLWTLTPGKPSLAEAVALRTALIPVESLDTTVVFAEDANTVKLAKPPVVPGLRHRGLPAGSPEGAGEVSPSSNNPKAAQYKSEPLVEAPLICVACCRSGDKGDAANVGVIARDPKHYDFLMENITEEFVQSHLEKWLSADDMKPSTVHRYLLPGFHAMNFVLTHVLGGGGLVSLKGDKQGKSIASILLTAKIQMPRLWVDEYQEGVGALKAQIRSQL